MKIRDKALKVDVDVRVRECLTFTCYWPRMNPGTFAQGRGYSNPTKEYLCGTRHARGCPDVCERRELSNFGVKLVEKRKNI